MAFRVGTSGWSYDDWAGVFYPCNLKKDRWLEYYMRFFHTTEIDSTYYRFPSPAMVNGWIERASKIESFEYSPKMPKPVTHDSLLSDKNLALQFQDQVLAPLAAADCLGCTLLQLSPYFRLADNNERTGHLERLAALLESLDTASYKYAVEFRHASWLSGGRLDRDTANLLHRHDVAACIVDGPSMPPIVEDTASHAFVRFHGHNEDLWYAKERKPGDTRMNRYDYDYGEWELAPWKGRLDALKAGTVRAYFNNHPHANSVKNAKLFESLLGIESAPLPLQKQADLSEFF